MLQRSDKYLYFSYEYDGGLDSKTYDLVSLIRVALSLGRIPIIKEARTSFAHRLDDIEQDVSIDWDEHINLSAVKILETTSDGTIKELSETLRYVHEKDFDWSCPESQVRHVHGLRLYNEENETIRIIILARDKGNLRLKGKDKKLPKIYKGLYFSPRLNAYFKSPFYVVIPPSKRVESLSDIVINHFGTKQESMKLFTDVLYDLPRFRKFSIEQDFNNFRYYACMHVRFAENSKIASKEIKHADYLRKGIEAAVKNIYEMHSKNMPLYIMSNIMDSDYFDFLKPKYNIYRYTDFEKLVEQVSQDATINHNLLYSVEKNIMRYAAVKIHSYRRNRFVFEGAWYRKGSYYQSSVLP